MHSVKLLIYYLSYVNGEAETGVYYDTIEFPKLPFLHTCMIYVDDAYHNFPSITKNPHGGNAHKEKMYDLYSHVEKKLGVYKNYGIDIPLVCFGEGNNSMYFDMVKLKVSKDDFLRITRKLKIAKL
jgi:hypothetical protein